MSNVFSAPMSLNERLFHSVFFEMGAITVATILVKLFSNTDTSSAIGVGIVMAMMAMVWNFVFNFGFDKAFTAPRETRGLGLRVFHTISFEAGLLVFTIPVLAYLLGLSLWHAFLADVGLTIVITVYALIFNYLYDHLRLKVI
ncbi:MULTISPECIES: PACE efflux transporter [unclassified Mannheimia]|uniref:PACE efflux transporter n=1 Tax=unclassified Mannheimia TaxID=2645054 RepID=UPI00359EE8AF